MCLSAYFSLWRRALHPIEEQEGNQKEHELMPTIIQRFSELGTVIESQKRHIDRWKQKELDLAICEAQQNLDLIRDLGAVRVLSS